MDLIIFDLDGTLIDSKQDLAQAANATRRHMGMDPITNEAVYSYVGNGAPVLIRRVLGPEASDADVERGLEFFLEYYSAHKLDHTQLYPGVKEALDRLLAAGVRMAVLTNKPVRISRAIVEGLGVGAHFCRVYGGNSFEKKKPDPEGVRRIMEECGASRERTLVVGDSSVDVITARSAGVMVFGVTYGFQPESLADPAPDMVMERMEDVAEWVIGQRTGAKQ